MFFFIKSKQNNYFTLWKILYNNKGDNMEEKNTKRCIECGAICNKYTCEEVFHKILGMEWEYPKLGKEHFKTVACYYIQHPHTYSEEGLNDLKKALNENIIQGVETDEIRKRHQIKYNGSKKVREDNCIIKPRNWNITIQDCLDEDGNKIAEKIVKLANYIIEGIDFNNR